MSTKEERIAVFEDTYARCEDIPELVSAIEEARRKKQDYIAVVDINPYSFS